MTKNLDTEIIRATSEAELDIKIAEWKSKNPNKILESTFINFFSDLGGNMIEVTITFSSKDMARTISNEKYGKQFNCQKELASDCHDVNRDWSSKLSSEPVYSNTIKSCPLNTFHKNICNDLNKYDKPLNKLGIHNELNALDIKKITAFYGKELENSIDKNKERSKFLKF